MSEDQEIPVVFQVLLWSVLGCCLLAVCGRVITQPSGDHPSQQDAYDLDDEAVRWLQDTSPFSLKKYLPQSKEESPQFLQTPERRIVAEALRLSRSQNTLYGAAAAAEAEEKGHDIEEQIDGIENI